MFKYNQLNILNGKKDIAKIPKDLPQIMGFLGFALCNENM